MAQPTNHSDNRRVAKNAIALTLRTILTTIVGLYVSRIVLEALGVDDYGIYGVIGGVVGMASFLNASMSGATSRFITFELGTGNTEKLKKIFSSALLVHIIIAIIVAILAETVGLWFVNNKMNFPPGSMFSVNVLYQFTILSMFVGFTQVPYSAAIMAHEKMNIYAYFEIINVVLKLGIVYLLLVINGNRLIFYAAMMLLVSVISAMIYRMYCIRHFKETKFRLVWDKSILKSMLAFSGLDLYGHMCVVFKNQLQPIFLNIFFGVVANASASLALTVSGAVGGLTTTIAQAFRPQVIKQYSTGNISGMAVMMRRSAQFTLLAYSIIALPVFWEANSLIHLWLGQVPEYSVEFLRLIIIGAFFNIVVNTNNAAIHATGNIKNISFISGTFYLLGPILSYIVLKFVLCDAWVVYTVDILIFFIVALLGFYFVHLQIVEFPLRQYLAPVVKTYLSILISFLIVGLTTKYIDTFVSQDYDLHRLLLLFIVSVIGAIVQIILTLYISFDRGDRKMLFTLIAEKLRGVGLSKII